MEQPLFLEPVFHEKIWGGDRLSSQFGYTISTTNPIGECWGISGHPNGLSVIANGIYKGWTLDNLYQKRPDLFNYPEDKCFPLLTKILDANDWLSVQVHPDDSYALSHEGELGKTECWYVLEAQEGAEIILGHQAKSKKELKDAFETADWERVLTRRSVKKGDFIYVPSGTIHAIGPGLLILETQQSSDTTYRVYDFDRVDSAGNKRELHLSKSLDVTTLEAPKEEISHKVTIDALSIETFISNSFFTVARWDLEGKATLTKDSHYQLVSVIDGGANLSIGESQYTLVKGNHFILPSPLEYFEMEGTVSLIVSQL